MGTRAWQSDVQQFGLRSSHQADPGSPAIQGYQGESDALCADELRGHLACGRWVVACSPVEISKFRRPKVAPRAQRTIFRLIEIELVPQDPCGRGDQML